MRRAELEHIIRAAATVADDPEIVVVGSQAILGSHPEAPSGLLASMDADVFPRTRTERAVVIDGAIGEGSPFHETFGYYAHGVGPETAQAPGGWEERLVAVRNENTSGATGWCLAAHDLVLAKLVAGREKDVSFARESLRHGLVRIERLTDGAERLPVDEACRAAVRSILRGV